MEVSARIRSSDGKEGAKPEGLCLFQRLKLLTPTDNINHHDSLYSEIVC